MRKGNNLCHGVSGNAYAFLSVARALYKKYQKEPSEELFSLVDEQIRRALHFAEFALSDEAEMIQGGSSEPLSLFEGSAGLVCFLADLLPVFTDEGNKNLAEKMSLVDFGRFPLFEIFD